MADDKALRNLVKQYERARKDLVNAVIYAKGAGTKAYANALLRRVERILKSLKVSTAEYADEHIRDAYEEALEDIRAYYARNGIPAVDASFAQIHEDAIRSLAKEMQYEVAQGVTQVGRRIARHVQRAVDDALRQAALEQTGRKIATGATLRDMKTKLVEQLQDSGIFSVQYGEGPRAYRVSLDAYASMVARSTTREAGNTARINGTIEYGHDLVSCTSHYPTCEVCAPLQGRVYSISGKDARFPALSSLPGFKDGYYTIHPNCRHVFVPTVESLWTDEERQQYMATANAPLQGDTRSTEEIRLYQEQQAKNRKMRQDMYQYERYKAVLGDDAPKTLAAFKRIKGKNGEQWQYMQLDYRRRNALLRDNGLLLPNVDTATIDSRKFTKYLFDPESARGWPKGVAIISRLGYNADNWTKLRDEIQKKSFLYPAVYRLTDEFGDAYEQKIVVYGLKGKPANMIIGWKVNGSKTWMTTLYLKEV